MTEAEFHGKRRMWADNHGHFVLAPERYPYGHFEWFCGLFGIEKAREWHRNATRGYYYAEGLTPGLPLLVAYIGEDFAAVGCDIFAIETAVKVFGALYGPVAEVGVGARPRKEQPWLPRNLSALGDFQQHVTLARIKKERERRVASEELPLPPSST